MSYYKQHREKILRNSKKYYQTHKEACKQRRRAYYLTHREKERAYRRGLKYEIFKHYSSGQVKCVICGETDIIILCLDHINNDGAEHRKIAGVGTNFYCWLRAHNYPWGLQVLCYNCNARKEFEYQR